MKINNPVKKKVHWDKNIEDNEKKSDALKKLKFMKKELDPAIKQYFKELFNNGQYDNLRKELGSYRAKDIGKILSLDNYFFFYGAVLYKQEVQALELIVDMAPFQVTRSMLHSKNLVTLRMFLSRNASIERDERYNEQIKLSRIQKFKLLLKIDETCVKEFMSSSSGGNLPYVTKQTKADNDDITNNI